MSKMTEKLFLDNIKFCISENRYLKYRGQVYSQTKGMPMGSPASPVITDLVMEELLDKCIDKLDKKPRFMTKYVDDLFTVIRLDQIDNTLNI